MKHDICFFTEAIRKQRAKCREDGRKSLAQTWDRYHLMTLQFSRAVYGTSSHVNVHRATRATSGFLGIARNSGRPYSSPASDDNPGATATSWNAHSSPVLKHSSPPGKASLGCLCETRWKQRQKSGRKEFHDPGRQRSLFLALSSTKRVWLSHLQPPFRFSPPWLFSLQMVMRLLLSK